MKPTRFQSRTSDYAFKRMWDEKNPAYRFLVADEVGLGKTIVARDIISRTLDRFPRRKVDIVYVCSSQAIASQNLRKLLVGGSGQIARATRLSLLALGDASDSSSTKTRYYAITPDTSFNIGNAAGSVRERALIYFALKSRLRPAGLSPFLQERVTDWRWKSELDYVQRMQPDRAILKAFVHEVMSDQDIVSRIRTTARDAMRGLNDKNFQRTRRVLIGALRQKLAAAGVSAVAPTGMIIVDEFQKFAQLLQAPHENSTLAQKLAARLFRTGDPNRRVLLLSATPYRVTADRSDSGEKPYENFVDLIRFMAGDDAATELDAALNSFALELRAPELDEHKILAARNEAQNILSAVMTRTERVSWTRDADSMVSEFVKPLDVEVEDFEGAVDARKIARLIKAQDPVEYWKSAPYFLDFMRDYQFRKLAIATAGKDRRELAQLARGKVLIDQATLRRQQSTPMPNARLRHLIDDALPHGSERLLWVPPSLPYLQPGGPFKQADPAIKRLVFSEWRLAPDAIAALTSYEAERRLAAEHRPAKKGRRGRTVVRDTSRAHADFAKHGELLRLVRAKRGRFIGQEQYQAALALLVPSRVLAKLGDPLALALSSGGAVPISSAVDQVRPAVIRAMKLLPTARSKGRIDERWYWAAPMLLDKAASQAWLDSGDPFAQQLEKGDDIRLDAGIIEVLARPDTLGPRPKDLATVLSHLALAGPGVCALRAIDRNFPELQTAHRPLRAAFHIARGFQALFNQGDASLAVQAGRSRKQAYWRQALAYALDGNIQSLMDEQMHLHAEALSLYEGTVTDRLEKAVQEFYGALTLRRAVVEVSGLERRRGGRDKIESVGLRCRHALRFAEIKEPDGGVSRLDAVRAAFNSPFRPFVLASTTVGQEGLDFHPWCHAVVHWNLPRTPVELEQREGRVHRYKGHAVRLNIANTITLQDLVDAGYSSQQDPWAGLFALAADREPDNELAPSWLFEGDENPRRIRRIVPLLDMSRESEFWPRLKARLGIYRLVMGLPRQEDLLSALEGRVSPQQASAWSIDLRPPR